MSLGARHTVSGSALAFRAGWWLRPPTCPDNSTGTPQRNTSPQQRHVCYLHLPQASASALQRHSLMLKQVPACIRPPPHPLTQLCLVVLIASLSDHKEGSRKRLLDLPWLFSSPRLSHERASWRSFWSVSSVRRIWMSRDDNAVCKQRTLLFIYELFCPL